MKKKNKIVYMAFSADILHEGHINIINKASKLGKLVVGLLTDEAISSFKNIPFLNYNQRYSIIWTCINVTIDVIVIKINFI